MATADGAGRRALPAPRDDAARPPAPGRRDGHGGGDRHVACAPAPRGRDQGARGQPAGARRQAPGSRPRGAPRGAARGDERRLEGAARPLRDADRRRRLPSAEGRRVRGRAGRRARGGRAVGRPRSRREALRSVPADARVPDPRREGAPRSRQGRDEPQVGRHRQGRCGNTSLGPRRGRDGSLGAVRIGREHERPGDGGRDAGGRRDQRGRARRQLVVHAVLPLRGRPRGKARHRAVARHQDRREADGLRGEAVGARFLLRGAPRAVIEAGRDRPKRLVNGARRTWRRCWSRRRRRSGTRATRGAASWCRPRPRRRAWSRRRRRGPPLGAGA